MSERRGTLSKKVHCFLKKVGQGESARQFFTDFDRRLSSMTSYSLIRYSSACIWRCASLLATSSVSYVDTLLRPRAQKQSIYSDAARVSRARKLF